MPKQTIRDLDLKGQRVLVRVDFNVPQKVDGSVASDRRIREALPTLNFALERGASLVLASHLGRPSGDAQKDALFRMAPVTARLQELLVRPVTGTADTVGPEAKAACAALQPGGVVLLENLRFQKGEEKGDVQYAKELAALADCYVTDAFGTCHRDHASMLALAEQFPAARRGIGFLIEKELKILKTLLREPKHPMVAVMGGAKVSDKIGVIENLLPRIERLLIGGAMTYTFLKAQGHAIGKSRFEENKLDQARRLLELAGDKMCLPTDHRVGSATDPAAAPTTVVGPDLGADQMGMDIGPATAAAYREIILKAGTVVWNGPMGRFEDERYREGTQRVAQAMADCPGVTVVGGGETAEAVEEFGLDHKMSHVSTGGGAFLEALEGKMFNSLKAIPDR